MLRSFISCLKHPNTQIWGSYSFSGGYIYNGTSLGLEGDTNYAAGSPGLATPSQLPGSIADVAAAKRHQRLDEILDY